MENASEALIMAFSVLVFVLALSISIHSFGQAKATSEMIMERSDSAYDTTFVDYDSSLIQNVDGNEQNTVVTRTVGAETIIPTLYRAYKENLVIVFADDTKNSDKQFKDIGIFAQKKKDGSGYNDNPVTRENNTIDLQALNIGSEDRATEFITYLLHSNSINNDYLQNKFNSQGTQNYKSLRKESLYDTIKKSTFREFIGMYYMEDLKETEESDPTQETDISDANKTKRRVITYVLQEK